MNILIPFLLICASCSTYKAPPIPAFDKNKVCSESSLAYASSGESGAKPISPADSEIVTEHLRKVQFLVKSCYHEYIQINQQAPSFNLCFVTGADRDGKRDFFEFSSNEQKMTSDFWECLMEIGSTVPLDGLKQVYILQSFRLYPGLAD